MVTDLAAVKAYMKIDDDCDDALIENLAGAAERYLKTAGVVSQADAPDGRYTLAVCALTLHYYEFRTTGGDLPPALRHLVNQLKAEGAGAHESV